MRGSLAKRIRQHVREEYPFLHASPIYARNRVTGCVVLAKECQRKMVKHMKKQYKTRKANGEII